MSLNDIASLSQSLQFSKSFKAYYDNTEQNQNDIYLMTFGIQIIDNGPGITEQGIKKMFNDF